MNWSTDHDNRTQNIFSIKYHFARSKCVFIKLKCYRRRFSENSARSSWFCQSWFLSKTNIVRSYVFLLDYMIGDRPYKWPWISSHAMYAILFILSPIIFHDFFQFHEHSHSRKFISEIDFARIILRNTVLTEIEFRDYLDRLKEGIKEPKVRWN